TALFGLYLFFAPWIDKFRSSVTESTSAWASGILIVTSVASGLLTSAHWQKWLSASVTLWLLIAPWVLGFDQRGRIDHFVVGIYVLILLLLGRRSYVFWDLHGIAESRLWARLSDEALWGLISEEKFFAR